MLLVLVGLLVSGCASTELGEARELGDVGSRSSAKLVDAATSVEAGFDQTIDEDSLLQPLQDSTRPPAGVCSFVGRLTPLALPSTAASPPSSAIARIRRALAARRMLAISLSKTYAAWNGLTQYDASGQVSAGVSSLFDATNDLRTSEGMSPVPAAVGTISRVVAGGIAGRAQKRRLKAASMQIRVALVGYRDALLKGQDATVSVMQNSIGEQYDLTIALWQRGYLSARPLIASVGATSGLDVPIDEKATMSAADEGLCNAIRAYLETRRDTQEANVAAEYQAQVDALNALIAAHEDFEKGAHLSLDNLVTLVDQVNALATGVGGKK